MSIRILSDSHMPHLTVSTVSVSTQYLMDINDFYNGYGVHTTCDGTVINYRFILPSIGTKYVQYYFKPELTGYWQDVVLGDITSEKTSAHDFGSIDTTGWDLDKKVIVTYTWSNTAKKDIITANDQSSVRFNIETNTQIETTDIIIDTSGDYTSAAHKFFTLKNPTIYRYISDTESENRGPYNAPLDAVGGSEADAAGKEALQRYHRDNNESPAHEKHTTQTILTVTAYSKRNYFFLISDNTNKINSVDFMSNPYSEREQRLQEKGRLPTYEFTDIATQDDSFKWLFYDYTKIESGIDLYKYDLFFLYKTDKWTKWYGSDVNEYEQINFNTVLLTPMFNTGI